MVSWGTCKHQSTDTSTAQAEFVAMHNALKEITFVKAFYTHILDVNVPAIIMEDNSAALNVALGTETQFSRFLLTKYFAIRKAVMDSELIVKKVSTEDQLADIMTKALDRSKFEVIRDFLLQSLEMITNPN